MKIGLVGYFGFGNYGDEMFIDVYRTAFPKAELTVLRGCDGVTPHDPAEVARQDCIIIGGGDLVIASGFSDRYWNPALLRRPVFIVGVGVDASRGHSTSAVKRMKEFFRHKNVKLITTRDPDSRTWITSHLEPRIPVETYPDMVASIPMQRTQSDRPTLGLVLRAQHDEDPTNVQRLLDRASDLGYHTKNIVLGTGYTQREDLPVSSAVRADELVGCNDIHSITRAISTCDVLVSQRLHGCVAGVMMGIPTVGLRDVGKFQAWFGHFDGIARLYRVDDPRLPELLGNRLPAVDAQQVERVRTQAQGSVRRLIGAVSGIPTAPPVATGYYDTFLNGPEQQRARWAELSPRLRLDPGADLRLEQELRWYRGEIARWKGPSYLETIDRHVEDTPELKSLPKGTTTVVAIPVAAAAEYATIHDTLSLYAQQDSGTLASTTLLLFVNYPDDAHTDPGTWTAVSATISEIERARDSFPGLRVALVTEAFDHRLPKRHNGIIGYVARRMYDVALMAALRGLDTGELGADDVLLIRNDADACGLSRRYLERMIAAAERHPEADVFIGGIRWGTALYEDFPGFGVAMGFKEGIRTLTMRRDVGYQRLPATNGTNVAIKMSAMAAVGGVGHGWYYGAGGDDVEIGSRINAARRRARGTQAGRSPPITYVTDAQIDASGERALAVYRSGRSVIHTWNTFNNGPGGYTRRGDAADAIQAAPDRGDLDVTIERITQTITDLVTHWYNDRKLTESALRLMIGRNDHDGRPVYRTHWDHDKFRIEFTTEGRTWLQKRLGYNGTRQADRYGRRTRRALYGSSDSVPPRMVSPCETTLPPTTADMIAS